MREEAKYFWEVTRTKALIIGFWDISPLVVLINNLGDRVAKYVIGAAPVAIFSRSHNQTENEDMPHSDLLLITKIQSQFCTIKGDRANDLKSPINTSSQYCKSCYVVTKTSSNQESEFSPLFSALAYVSLSNLVWYPIASEAPIPYVHVYIQW